SQQRSHQRPDHRKQDHHSRLKNQGLTGETYKEVVKVTFAKGAVLQDPSEMFNSSLDGTTRRAIDFREDDTIDDDALKALIRAAIAHNVSKKVRT
ncbi:MAG: DUF1801 domain-containing protein, partial [Mycobacteriaceae bacterium]|nr:DUF1801 domain-containing protein [Mycobacteriaceae bacterium]